MIMMVITSLSLILRFGIKKLLEINIAQNESNAQVQLKLISAALENYAKDNNGVYPSSLSNLLKAHPPYLKKDYTVQTSFIRGYDYSCPRLMPTGYTCYATPLKCRLTGKLAYTITTDGILLSEDCSK
jgi:type II secretory pathway pseudopilin PulG